MHHSPLKSNYSSKTPTERNKTQEHERGSSNESKGASPYFCLTPTLLAKWHISDVPMLTISKFTRNSQSIPATFWISSYLQSPACNAGIFLVKKSWVHSAQMFSCHLALWSRRLGRVENAVKDVGVNEKYEGGRKGKQTTPYTMEIQDGSLINDFYLHHP